ncbi:MAG: MBL fold metallo-hydrolase [Clostridia bacterium]|nr:MBL fold metallo-hydrolase [Clostridia bacterium]
MKIKFLGTSHGRAEVNRYCTSYMITHNGKNYIIDVGAPVEYLLTNSGITLDKISAFFITHMHCDHASELPTIIKNFVHYNKGKTTIFMPDKNAIEPLLAWSQALGENRQTVLEHITFNVTYEGVIYNENGLTVTAIKTEHLGTLPSFAFMLETSDNKRVLFTGDLATNHRDFPKIAYEKEFDLIVSEFAHFADEPEFNSMKTVNSKQIILAHLGAKHIAKLNELKPEFACPYLIASDGLEYTL